MTNRVNAETANLLHSPRNATFGRLKLPRSHILLDDTGSYTMYDETLFFSYNFGDPKALALMAVSRSVARRLPRVRIVDGKILDPSKPFSQEIISFIKSDASAVLAVFTDGEHRNANILFEVGVAVGAEKKIILVGYLGAVPSMLRSYEVIEVDSADLSWEATFRTRLEKKLRIAFQIREDHFVEEKLRRRYSEEEFALFKDRSRNQSAIQSIRSGDLARASAILERVVQKNPFDIDVLFLLTDVYYLRGLSSSHPSERDSWFSKQIKTAADGLIVEPSSTLLLHSLARGLLRTEKLAEARQTLCAMLEQTPNYSVAMYDLACVSTLLGDIEDGFRWLASAIERDKFWREFAKTDPDFADIQADNRWDDLIFPSTSRLALQPD